LLSPRRGGGGGAAKSCTLMSMLIGVNQRRASSGATLSDDTPPPPSTPPILCSAVECCVTPDPSAGGLETLAMIADRGQSERARTSAVKVWVCNVDALDLHLRRLPE